MVTSAESDRLICYGTNDRFQLGIGSTNQSATQGCFSGDPFTYTDIGFRSLFFPTGNGYQSPFSYGFQSGAALPFQVLNYTSLNGNTQVKQFNITCTTSTRCRASPVLAPGSGAIWEYKLVDCNGTFPSQCRWNSGNGRFRCRFASDQSPISWNIFVFGPGGKQSFVMIVESITPPPSPGGAPVVVPPAEAGEENIGLIVGMSVGGGLFFVILLAVVIVVILYKKTSLFKKKADVQLSSLS